MKRWFQRETLDGASRALTLITAVGLLFVAMIASDQRAAGLVSAPVVLSGPEGAGPPRTGGMLCQDSRLRGLRLEPFTEGICGSRAPVSVQSAAGARLSPVAVTECVLAERLADWMEQEVSPAAEALFGERVVGVTHYSAYACRRRNSEATAPLSLHGLARALDVAAFELESGRSVSVLDDWRGEGPAGPQARAFLQRISKGACGRFGTVLSPDSGGQHVNHIHLDMAPRREPFCR